MKTMAFVLSLLTLSVVTFTARGEGAKVRPTLTGRVLNNAGEPARDATVFIFSGGPRVGTSSYCPTCYPDCRKRAQTDAKGEFEIADLDPKLLFRLLVVKKNHKAQFVPRTDPLKGPVEVRIEPRAETFPKNQALRGRALDPEGKPISRAVVNFEFFGGQDANCGGQCDGVDLVAVTDEEGKFIIGAEKKFDWMTVKIEAPGLARTKFFKLSSDESHDLKVNEGATVVGHVVKDDKPMKGIPVGLVSVDRSENFTGSYDTFSDEDGKFFFKNVPPFQIYYVYSMMEGNSNEAVAPAQRVRVAADGSRKDIGKLALLPGLKLKGRVRLADNMPVPPNITMILSRNGAWDSKTFPLNADGSFETSGIPVEAYSLSVRIPGYTISSKNKSLDRLNGGSLVGRIDADTYVEILMERGNFQRPDFRAGEFGPDAQPYDKPLQGVGPDKI